MALSATRPRKDPRFGVDSRWSWVTVGFLSWFLFMSTISQQAMGVLFYGIVHGYGVNREEAAWPIIFCGTCISLAGPAMGYLCRRFSCQAVLFACSVAGGVSLGACCLTDDIRLLTFLYGFVQGVAMSGSIVAVSVLVSQHFERFRATACSVTFFFSGLNMLLAPPLAELFRSTYGIRGTFLLLGAVTLNACPAVIILRSPDWMKEKKRSPDPGEDGALKDMTAVQTTNQPLPDIMSRTVDDHKTEHEVQKLQGTDTAKTPLPESDNDRANHLRLLRLCLKRLVTNGKSDRTIASIARLFLTLPFAVHALTFIVLTFGVATFILLSVDIAKDRGVPPSSAVFLMTVFAIGDLTLRALSGVVIDTGLLSLEAVLSLGFLLQAIAFELFVWLRTFPTMLACSVLIGVSNGSKVSLQAPALVKDFGIEPLSVLLGGVLFCNGLALLTRPALIGYCRDILGSYDLLLHLVSLSSVVLSAAWLAKNLARKKEQRSNVS